jgi:hypothetical protein
MRMCISNVDTYHLTEGMPKLIADITQQSVAMDALMDWLQTGGRLPADAQASGVVDAEADKGAVKREILALHQHDLSMSYAQIGSQLHKPLSKQRVGWFMK